MIQSGREFCLAVRLRRHSRTSLPTPQRVREFSRSLKSAAAMELEQMPRRIVLSRKGSDSTWGGRPSLRVGSELISLPIPESASRAAAAEEAGTGIRYSDLPKHPLLGGLHTHLRDMAGARYVHLDPDLRPELRPPAGQARVTRDERLFGQVGAAERHLRNQDVGPGDLFLFFGWFRETVQREGAWKRVGPEEHCLWGWLQIEESHLVADGEAAAKLPWAAHHPHVAHWDRYDRNNRVYRARERLSFAPELPGAGVFRWHPELTLTQHCGEAVTRRQWCLPGFVRRTGLTYNQVDGPRCPASRGRVHLSSAAIGQEFVMPAHRPFQRSERATLREWLGKLFYGADGADAKNG